ncbi:hypothetical protein G9A89_003531 [Geosiphon pyriformis]|nr:hypothetical protein G9A89_003531 [Geosiphon pyriformis]
MRHKEIKRTRPEAHDCNLCSHCQECIEKNGPNSCRACWFIFFETLYRNFSSGNEAVDAIIKNPVYIRPNNNDLCKYRLVYYEWIPWESLSNINEIARGGFGIIYKATLIDGFIDKYTIKHHGEMEYERERANHKGKKIDDLAIKIIKRNSSEVIKELNIQRPNYNHMGHHSSIGITSIWGITQNAETLEYGIVMEFAKHGDMRKYLSTNFHSMSWACKLRIAHQIAFGLYNIHYYDMVHRDLHSGNILQLKNDYINIGDLGLCQPVNHEETTTGKATKKKNIYGVIPYIPPEVLRGEKFTTAGDIYSYAMLLWELATGKPPFHDLPHDLDLIFDIVFNSLRPKITSPLIPPSIAEIIEMCWDGNPKNRPTAKEVRQKLDKISRRNFEFLESEEYVKEMVKNDTETTTPTRIHPGAVFTSRVLSWQRIEESKG